MEQLCISDKERTQVFLNRDEGTKVLGYLLRMLARKAGLKMEVHNQLYKIFQVLERHYAQPYSQEFLEMVLYNMSIWMHSEKRVQQLVIESMRGFLVGSGSNQEKAGQYIDILLNGIEAYAGDSDADQERITEQMAPIAKICAESFFSERLLNALISHANVYYVRMHRNYVNKIYHCLTLFNDIGQIIRILFPLSPPNRRGFSAENPGQVVFERKGGQQDYLRHLHSF